jgi:hypothetical protein
VTASPTFSGGTRETWEVTVTPDDLLARMAVTLRDEIGPAVAEPFAKTQAFMAAVIIDKLAGQIRSAAVHADADRDDRVSLVADIEAELAAAVPPSIAAALVSARDTTLGLGALVAAIYAARAELGNERFDALLARVRTTLRARLDRQLEYAS